MKVLQISTSDYARGGGGAIAMYQLHVGLRNSGIDCKILSAIKTLESTQRNPSVTKIRVWIENHIKFRLNNIHCVGSFKVRKKEFYLDADIINFHVLHSGFFSYLAIPH